MRGCLTGIIVVLVIAVVLVVGLGYFGLVPAIAGLFGSDQPRDLGIRYTQADLDSLHRKSQTRIIALPANTDPAKGWQATGQVPVSASFTDEELTAVLANGAKQWKFWPVTDGQMRINQDGSVEVAARLNMDGMYSLAEGAGIPRSAVQSAMGALKVVSGNPAIYIKASGSIVNGKSNLHVEKAEIGRLPVPLGLVTGNRDVLLSTLDSSLKASGIDAKSLTFTGGAANFNGTLPASRSLIAK